MKVHSHKFVYSVTELIDHMRHGRFHSRYWQRRLLFEKLRRIVNSDLLPPGEKLLDYGCGNKPYELLFRAKFNQYIGVDFPGNKHVDLALGPRGELPIKDESVDCVLSTQVLEHVQEPSLYLGEAHRVLKPKGALILSTHGIWQYHPNPTDNWRWTIDGLRLEVCRAGFNIVMMESVFNLASCALQLWQDATRGRIPRIFRPIYIWFLQSIIGVIERRYPDQLSYNASVYIVFARKTDFEIETSNAVSVSRKFPT